MQKSNFPNTTVWIDGCEHRKWEYETVSCCPAIVIGCAALLLITDKANAERLRIDDPICCEPSPLNTEKLEFRRINPFYDFYRNTFQDPGEANERASTPIPAQDVNTLGEVLNSAWYTNRKLTHQQMVQGPNDALRAPDPSAVWTVIAAKTEGVTPGFVIRDARGRRYVLKFDPPTNPEMATGADVVTAKLLYAIGYFVPENYLVHFPPEQLVVGEDVTFRDRFARERKITDRDVAEMLLSVAVMQRGPQKGKIRGVASLYVPGQPIGPFKYYGRRKGDRNDFIPHEHRRELRGLHAVSAWVNHHDARSINTLDTMMEENGIRYVRHYLIDFGSTLGSAATKSKSAREGNVQLLDFRSAAASFVSLGLYLRDWEVAHYPNYPSIGRIQYSVFNPEKWVPNYPNRAFRNRLPDDNFWAARKIMQFSDADIQAIVATGEYSDKHAENWLAECLIQRRDIISRTYFQQILPLDNFRVNNGRLAFDDLAVRYGFVKNRELQVSWARFDNQIGAKSVLEGANTFDLPEAVRTASAGTYWAAIIQGEDAKKTVTAYVRKTEEGQEVVAVERTW
jgi:hypothetical protein